MNDSLNILFIEDDEIEIMKFNRVLTTLNLKHNIIGAKNGEEALNVLKAEKKIPDLVLLDLNMPKINGIEFLDILKKDEVLKFLPVIILTTSNNHKDILECYNIGIAGYMLKPLKYDEYFLKVQKILEYWSHNVLIS